MIAQKKFDMRNAGELTLSPYVDVRGLGSKRLLLLRGDLGKHVLLETERSDFLLALFSLLKNGTTEEKLISFLRAHGIAEPESWIQICVKNGVIE